MAVTTAGVTALQLIVVTQSDSFFQVTSKVTHFLYIYNKISELLFQIINARYVVFPFIH